eukprot:188038-Pyramimonas_sp.AAC.2
MRDTAARRRGPRQGWWSTGHKTPRWAAGETGSPRPIAAMRYANGPHRARSESNGRRTVSCSCCSCYQRREVN